jgi:5-methylcytosine-specific restriction endonuclease McrA
MKRINPKTGKPFRHGDKRDDGRIFRCYDLERKNKSGYHPEQWITAERFEERRNKRLSHSLFLADYKMAKGCACCGYKDHPAALDFDHLKPDEKHIELAVMNGYSRERVLAEIAKCIVLCSNCHRLKTHDPEEFIRYWEMLHMHDDEPDEDTLEWLHGHRSTSSCT